MPPFRMTRGTSGRDGRAARGSAGSTRPSSPSRAQQVPDIRGRVHLTPVSPGTGQKGGQTASRRLAEPATLGKQVRAELGCWTSDARREKTAQPQWGGPGLRACARSANHLAGFPGCWVLLPQLSSSEVPFPRAGPPPSRGFRAFPSELWGATPTVKIKSISV